MIRNMHLLFIMTASTAAIASNQGAFAQATTSLKCGGTVYQVTTGNDSGQCNKTPDKGVICSDGKGNYAIASCAEGCDTTKGAGSCTIKTSSGETKKKPRAADSAAQPPAGILDSNQ
jgi:hypothetical protein